MNRRSPTAFIVEAFTKNLGLKIVGLLASLVLFVIVRGTEDAQRSYSVDVVALLPPASTDRMLVSELPDEIRITVRGSRSVLNSLGRDGIEDIQMDLRDGSAHFYYFERDLFSLPAGVSIVQIAPNAVPLTWVRRSERRLRIEPVLEGELPDGLLLGNVGVEPATVLVRGPASDVNRLDAVQTEPIELRGLPVGSHARRVPLVPLAEHVDFVIDSVQVRVLLQVEEEEGSRLLSDLEVSIVGGETSALRPSHVDVTLSGPRNRVEDLHPRRIVPFVDVSALEAGSGASAVAVQVRSLPEGIRAEVDPPELLVTLAPAD